MIAALFYARLRDRGFSVSFLSTAFVKGPDYNNRLGFLSKVSTSPTLDINERPALAFSAVYSRALYATGLQRAIFLKTEHLPMSLASDRRLNAWRVGRKLKGLLVQFRYPRLDDGFARPAL